MALRKAQHLKRSTYAASATNNGLLTPFASISEGLIYSLKASASKVTHENGGRADLTYQPTRCVRDSASVHLVLYRHLHWKPHFIAPRAYTSASGCGMPGWLPSNDGAARLLCRSLPPCLDLRLCDVIGPLPQGLSNLEHAACLYKRPGRCLRNDAVYVQAGSPSGQVQW